MKVIKPLDILGAERLLYTNAINIVPEWSSGITYLQSTEINRVIVYNSNRYWEALKGNSGSGNQPSADFTGTTWKLLGSSIPELPFTGSVINWSSSTIYTTGQNVFYNNYYYTSLQDSNQNRTPGQPGDTWWSKISISNQRAFIDSQISTSTYGSKLLTSTVSAPKANSVGVINPTGTGQVVVTCKSGSHVSGYWKTMSYFNPSFDKEVLYSICESYPQNKVVITGSYGTILYSKDAGNTWIKASTPSTTNRIFQVCYSYEKDMYVAVGTSQKLIFGVYDSSQTIDIAGTPVVWYSYDAETWYSASSTLNATADDKGFRICTYVLGNINKFIITGGNNLVYFDSTDGINWTRRTFTGFSAGISVISALGYETKFNRLIAYAVHGPSSNTSYIVSSSDGINWTNSSTSQAALASSVQKIVYNEQTNDFVCLSQNNKIFHGTNTGGGVSFSELSPTLPSGFTPFTLDSLPIGSDEGISKSFPTYITIGFQGGSIKAYRFTLAGNVSSDIVDITGNLPLSTPTQTPVASIYSLMLNSIFGIHSEGRIFSSNIVYYSSKDINTSFLTDWYDYFFADFSTNSEIVFLDIPSYNNNIITISLTSGRSSTNNSVSLGVGLVGSEFILGTTQWGASAGIIDYSRKETDEFGTTTFVERAYSKRMNVNLILPSYNLTKVQKTLVDIRSTPSLWISTNSSTYDVLIIYGFYKDFNLEIPYPEYSFCSLQIEGLT
jgi:hypothetical protein